MGIQNALGRSMLSRRLTHFTASQEGAVTTDWVVLTAAIVGLSAAVGVGVAGGTQDLAEAQKGCLKAYGNVMSIVWEYERQLKVAQKRCKKK